MKNNKHCNCKPRCYYLHRGEKEISNWKKSKWYKAFISTYEYCRINEEFKWKTEWREIRKETNIKWGIESKPMEKYEKL